MGGHFLTSKLLITCRELKLLYHYTSAFRVCLRSHSTYNSVLYVLGLYVWHCELLLWDVTLFM